ncbi:hypothetical protein BDZ45DRAFT_289566 [Acephala macrosclerotiorum]|nr:hypothetical protein BDZ45DRAFT_289566 [Acephala macrosclerotiorum]
MENFKNGFASNCSAGKRTKRATNEQAKLEERADKLHPYDPKKASERNAWIKGWGRDRVSREFVDWDGVNAQKQQWERNDDREEVSDLKDEELEEFEALDEFQDFEEELRGKDPESAPSMSKSDTRARLTSNQTPDTVSSRQDWKVFRRRPGMEPPIY